MRDLTHTSGPLDVLWQPRTLMWVVLVGEGLALVLALAPSPSAGTGRIVTFGLLSFAVQWTALLTLAALYAARGRLARSSARVIARWALVLLVGSTWLVAAVGHALFGVYESGGLEPIVRLTAIVVTVGVLGLAALQNYLDARQLEARTQRAELEALQARIRPHFLFNTLNTGAALVHHRPEEAERLLLDLADLFRAALAGPREISLEDELALVRRYLEIEALRFGERLRIDWDVPSVIPPAQVPALSIQPLVENAIRHGVERVPHGGRVEITLTTTAEHVVVRIRNPLVLSDAQPPTSHGVGLSASRARIEALTGGRGSVQTGRQGEHWVATVRLPRRPASGDRRRGA